MNKEKFELLNDVYSQIFIDIENNVDFSKCDYGKELFIEAINFYIKIEEYEKCAILKNYKF